MPTKEGGGNKQQPYDDATGRFIKNGGGNTIFKSFSKPQTTRDFNKEIQMLEEKSKGLSIFSPERKELTQKILDLKAQQNGYKDYEDEKKHIIEQNELIRERKKELKAQQEKEEQERGYKMQHRPTETGITADDITSNDSGLTYDILNKQALYDNEIKETMEQLNKVKNNPDGMVTIYRATTGDKINEGDWITLSPSYAKAHKEHSLKGEGNIIEQKVRVKDIQFAGDDIKEWGYYPQNNK